MNSRAAAVRRVELQYFDGCPNWQLVDRHLRALAAEMGFELGRRRVAGDADAAAIGFRGSPTILVDGLDAFPNLEVPVGLSCRMYRTPEGPDGAPTIDQLRSALEWVSPRP